MRRDFTFWRRGFFFIAIFFSLVFYNSLVFAQNRLIISQYIETSSGTKPKGIELWNPTDALIDFSADPLIILLGRNGDLPDTNVTVDSGTLPAGDVMVIGTDDIGTYLTDQGLSSVYFVEKGFTLNGDDALQIQVGGIIEDTFGDPGNDPGSAWSGNGVSTRNSNIELKDGITTGAVDGFTDPSGRFQTVSEDNSLTGFGVSPDGSTTITPKPEPSQSAQFSDPDSTTHSITLHWTDAGGEVPPDGYLLEISDANLSSILAPTDGTPESEDSDISDGTGKMIISQGVQTATVNGLDADKAYYFKMFSYTNSGSDIDYKTDTYASIKVTTDSDQSTGSTIVSVKAAINEFHYDNAGSDSSEFVEVAVDTSLDAAKLSVLLYNGHDGGVYKSSDLTEFEAGEIKGGWQLYSREYSSIQNGPDGLALVYHRDSKDTVLQFISYEGSFAGTEGAADGLTSMEIDASESSGTERGKSLGLAGILTGDGSQAVWTEMIATPGKMNDLESVMISSDTILSRTIITGDAGWRMMSSPVAGLTYNDFQTNTVIQGFPGAGPGRDKNLYTGYNGTDWSAPGNLLESVMSGHGFILYFFDNNLNGSTKLPIDFDLTGALPNTTVTVPLHANGDRFNLIGNPFPFYIDMSSLGVSGGSLASGVAQIWDAESGSYILSTEQDNRMKPYQGFFVQNDDASEVTFQTSNLTPHLVAKKVSNNSHAMIGLQLLKYDSSNNETVADRAAALYFGNDAEAGWDNWDVQKLIPLRPNYAILGIKGFKGAESVLQAEQSQPITMTSPMKFKVTVSGPGAPGKKILRWPLWENIPESWTIKLKDLKTGSVVDMRTDSLYEFTVKDIQKKDNDPGVKLAGISAVNVSSIPDPRFEITITSTSTGVENPQFKPHKVSLSQNYPNPFNPETEIKFYIPRSQVMRLTVYDILGRRVAELVDGTMTTGWHAVTWNADNFSSGVYFYRLETPDRVLVKKMLLIK